MIIKIFKLKKFSNRKMKIKLNNKPPTMPPIASMAYTFRMTFDCITEDNTELKIVKSNPVRIQNGRSKTNELIRIS
jgi:hypothetical protein